ncbi:hypothetical protein GGR58DRAFT_266256 [Xylaria digitata]|nr:hypothetical protein GGR58DRAFT_266256 [Xylaria digitata]
MEPPPYNDHDGHGMSDTINDTINPVILVLVERLVHSESTGSSVLYELDHDVRFLSRADHKVVFSRHELRVRTSQHGAVRTTSHQKHIFNLENPHALTSTSRYPFFLTSVSRKTLGNVGLKKTSVPRPGFKVMQISRSGEDAEIFEITRTGDRYEWWDNEGKRIAIEDNSNDQLKMIITTALPGSQADVRTSPIAILVLKHNVLQFLFVPLPGDFRQFDKSTMAH